MIKSKQFNSPNNNAVNFKKERKKRNLIVLGILIILILIFYFLTIDKLLNL